jgi:regulator of replication initiation timing
VSAVSEMTIVTLMSKVLELERELSAHRAVLHAALETAHALTVENDQLRERIRLLVAWNNDLVGEPAEVDAEAA